MEDSEHLKELQNILPGMIEPGEDRSMEAQALMQFVALAITFGIAVVTGVVTGKTKSGSNLSSLNLPQDPC